MPSAQPPITPQPKLHQQQASSSEIKPSVDNLSASQTAATFYHNVLQQIQEGVIVLDPALRYQYWNPAMERITGLTSEEVLGKHILEVVPYARENGIYALEERALAGHITQTDSIRFLHPITKNVQWHSARHSPLRDESGMVIGVIVTVREVTAQKEAELRLAESEERFRKVFEAGPLGIAIVDLTLHFAKVNPAFAELLGYTEDELRLLTILNVTHPDDIAIDKEQLIGLLRGEITRRVREKRYLHKNGAVVWVSVTSVLIRDAANAPLYHVSIAKDISERRQAEAALLESKTQLRLALDNAQHGLWDWDIPSGHVDYDTTWHAVLGYLPGELDLRIETWAEGIHPDDRERLMAVLNRYLESDDNLYDVDYRARHKSGAWTWVNARGRVQNRDAHGRPLRMMGTIHDITERKRIEEEWRASEERFRLAIQAMQEGFVLQNSAGEIVVCNQSAERILGLTADQMMGLTSFDPRWHAVREDGSDFPAATHPSMVSLKQGIPQHEVLMGVYKPSGELIWASVNSVPIRQGEEILGVVITFADVTARREAETVLRESEERFRLLVDSLPLMIWMTNARGEIIFLNRFRKEFIGDAAAEPDGSDWQEAIHPEDLAVMKAEFARAMENRQPHQAEFRVRHHDGQYRWVLDSCRPRFATDGTFLGYIGSSLDITERKTMLAQMEEASKLEGLGRLAGGIAHDFNNMLTGVIGYAELAKMELDPETDAALYINNVLISAESAVEVTRQLLMYARRQMVEFDNINLNDVILRIEPLLRRMIGAAYELIFVLSETIWTVHTNASQMEQVLLNLCINARDAMPGSGRIVIETANVTLDMEYAAQHIGITPGEYVMFTVSDNGSGMAPDVKEHIFEPFFTTKPVGQGTGLGLATCYGIVKQSNGNILVYSELGQGTTFKVYLPRQVDEAVSEAHIPEVTGLEGNETILLVDDEPLVRDVTSRILRSQGYRVLEAGNGPDALHLQREWPEPIDLLITDVVMPLMSGNELAQRLIAERPDTKVIYLSGYTQNVIVQQGVLKSGVTLITKPFSTATLLQKVRAILNTAAAP